MALENILESADTMTLSSVERSNRPYQKHTVGWKQSDTKSTLCGPPQGSLSAWQQIGKGCKGKALLHL